MVIHNLSHNLNLVNLPPKKIINKKSYKMSHLLKEWLINLEIWGLIWGRSYFWGPTLINLYFNEPTLEIIVFKDPHPIGLQLLAATCIDSQSPRPPTITHHESSRLCSRITTCGQKLDQNAHFSIKLWNCCLKWSSQHQKLHLREARSTHRPTSKCPVCSTEWPLVIKNSMRSTTFR